MKKTNINLALCISLSLLFACSPAEKVNPTTAQSQADSVSQAEGVENESERLALFFEEAYEQDLKMSPMTQSYRGIKWDYDKWDDISPEAESERVKHIETRLTQALAFDVSQLNETEKLSLEIFIQDIQRRLENDKFRRHNYIMQQFSAWHTRIPSFLINIHKIESISDAQDFIKRVSRVDELFAQLNAQLNLRAEAGIYPPRWSYDQMIQASANVIKGNPFSEEGEDSTLLKDFKQKLDDLGLSQAEKSGLIAQLNQALLENLKPAYQNLIHVLTEQQKSSPAGDGVWRLPQGREWYQNRLKWYTTTELTAKDVHELGLEHVTRIHGAMQKIMKQVGFEGSLQAFFRYMREDDKFYYSNDDEGRKRYLEEAKAYIDIMENKLPDYFGLRPKADMVVKRVEAFREQSAGKAFYQRPSPDGSRPGVYYANLYDMRSMPTYQMEALAYHEGIPGHHMQLSITQELEDIPEFQKYVSFTVYTEGWGLYTEELAKDMGFYQDPYSDFGRLAMELWRACRLVVDTGIHDMQWSREKAIDYLINNTPNPENDAVKAIERYIAMPGQATAYMIGKLKIMQLRENAKRTLGEHFDYKEFHDQVLMYGPIPLNILERKVNQWIASKQATS